MIIYFVLLFFFFFSSRRRHTRSKRDWSSDVCSSDLDERRPRTLRFDRGENRLMLRRRLARANGGILDQDIVLAGYLLDLVEERRRFHGALKDGLVLLDPFVAALPEIAVLDENFLFGPGRFVNGQLRLGFAEHAEKLAPNEEIDEENDGAGHDPGECALTLTHPLVPGGRHRGFPSRRNWA